MTQGLRMISALRDDGFFVIEADEKDQVLMEEVYGEAKEFFEKPIEYKRTFSYSNRYVDVHDRSLVFI